MARKNLLGALMGPPETKAATPRQTRAKGTAKPPAKGAVGAVSQTIAELKARAVTEIDPHLIEAGGLSDRLEHDEADHARLMASIRDYGQQVPVLVRPHPDPSKPDRYQIVYGRRRVLALRDLGMQAKAMIRDMDDEALLLAQGQENSARRDLSFIEKANFAGQMRDAGYKRKIICDALSIDKTQISRMLSIVDRIPVEVLEAIGSAPGIGRDRWTRFAELAVEVGISGQEAWALGRGDTSDERFEEVFAVLTLPSRRAAAAAKATAQRHPPERLVDRDGAEIARICRSRGRLTLVLPDPGPDGFADWLAENLDDLHRTWQKRGG